MAGDDDELPPRRDRRGLRAAGWVISLLFLGAVVWWALRQPAPELPRSAADLGALGMAVAVYALCTALRAERWRSLLEEAGARPSRADAYRLTLVGYMGNNVMPARAGDVLRVVLMAPRAATGRRTVVGTLLAERLLDVVTLALLFLILAATVAGGAGLPSGSTLAALTLAAVAALALAGAVWLVLHGRGAMERIRAFLAPMLTSTLNLRGAHGAGMAALTLAIWAGEAAVWGLVAAAVDLDATPLEVLYLLGLAGIFGLIPSGPGYAGTQDAAAVIGVKAIGGTSAQAIGYLIVLRFVLIVPITLAGVVVLAVSYRGTSLLRPAGR